PALLNQQTQQNPTNHSFQTRRAGPVRAPASAPPVGATGAGTGAQTEGPRTRRRTTRVAPAGDGWSGRLSGRDDLSGQGGLAIVGVGPWMVLGALSRERLTGHARRILKEMKVLSGPGRRGGF